MTAAAARRRAFSEEEITAALMAVIAWAGNVKAAHNALEAEGKLKVSYSTLCDWTRTVHRERYDELREKYADQLEAQLVHEYRQVARLAVDVQRSALERAQERLDEGKDQDPSRTAANAATVADKMTRNTLSLSGRPTSITEHRSPEEIMRRLMTMGVLALPEGTEE